ncbi:MAG: hypothetical protein J6A77_12100 [Lachnospiraceae bacterium]|nr:hypothetical protein [Lachnospiraceae bacterium]
MQQYQFEKIYSEMEKEFGKIKSGTEEDYLLMLLAMEGNALKIRRKYPAANSRRLKEAITLTLFKIKGYYTAASYDTDKFRDENNERLEYAILMAFDPFTNPEIKEKMEAEHMLDLENLDELHSYFKEPVMCLLRIKESIEFLEKKNGSDGYFDFIENHIGYRITGEELLSALVMPHP